MKEEVLNNIPMSTQVADDGNPEYNILNAYYGCFLGLRRVLMMTEENAV